MKGLTGDLVIGRGGSRFCGIYLAVARLRAAPGYTGSPQPAQFAHGRHPPGRGAGHRAGLYGRAGRVLSVWPGRGGNTVRLPVGRRTAGGDRLPG